MLTNHVWKLLDQCYLTLADTVWDNKKLKLANLIASLRILIFEIDYKILALKVSDEIDGFHYLCTLNYARHTLVIINLVTKMF